MPPRLTRESTVRFTELINCVRRAARYSAYTDTVPRRLVKIETRAGIRSRESIRIFRLGNISVNLKNIQIHCISYSNTTVYY